MPIYQNSKYNSLPQQVQENKDNIKTLFDTLNAGYDTALNDTSENAVQNKVVTEAINDAKSQILDISEDLQDLEKHVKLYKHTISITSGFLIIISNNPDQITWETLGPANINKISALVIDNSAQLRNNSTPLSISTTSPGNILISGLSSGSTLTIVDLPAAFYTDVVTPY